MIKFFKRVTSIIISFSIVLHLLTGCYAKVLSPEDLVNYIINLYVFNDTSAGSTIGISPEDNQASILKIKEYEIASLRKVFEFDGFNVSESKIEEIYNAKMQILKKINYEIEEVESTHNKKKIKFSTTFFNEPKVLKISAEKLVAKVEAGEITDLSQVGENLANIMIYEINNFIISDEKVSFETEFTKQKFNLNGKNITIWGPNDLNEFRLNIFNLISGEV